VINVHPVHTPVHN